MFQEVLPNNSFFKLMTGKHREFGRPTYWQNEYILFVHFYSYTHNLIQHHYNLILYRDDK
jgi:hypothetical protein